MIRSVTVGIPAFSSSIAEQRASLERLNSVVQEKLAKAGLKPRTLRLTLPALRGEGQVPAFGLASMLSGTSDLAASINARWFCLPIDMLSEGYAGHLEAAIDCLKRFPGLFLNLIVAQPDAIAIQGAHDAAAFILKVARLSSNGFDNFRIGTSSCCPSNAPFFPFSRHEGETLAFSFALETTPLALTLAEEARRKKATLAEFREILVARLADALGPIEGIAQEIADETGCVWKGMDASFAPFPGEVSVADLLTSIGAAPGALGSLFATSILTDTLRDALGRSKVKSVGFNGVMYSVLEDEGLARVNSNRALTLQGLSALASVCACGIDMVPVPANSFSEELAGCILDIAAMAVRLRKPLGVRLLPIPGRQVNERTSLNLDFLCDSRVMDIGHGETMLQRGDTLWRYLTTLKEGYLQ